jgi:hypothetical protein
LNEFLETLTVTGEAPLIEMTTSVIGGNVDPRQVAELPTYGRNWLGLAMVAPGSRLEPVAGSRQESERALPDRNDGETREFQFNVDGQQVTVDLTSQGQARYSADSIAEFQYISNRFDATQGRSTTVQVNVITKSGTNQLAGSVPDQLPPKPLQRAESGPGPGRADRQPAVQHDAGRPADAGQAALFRQLRVRT